MHHVDSTLGANRTVLEYLARGKDESVALVRSPESVQLPYLTLGSHPDIVERVWDELGQELSPDARCVVLGRPALVAPGPGLVLALALGTSYALRVAPGDREAALAEGLRTTFS
jgi:hypothetical protein